MTKNKVKRKFLGTPKLQVVPENVKTFKSVGDWRDFIFWILVDDPVGPPAPNWILVQNKYAMPKVVSLMVPGLEFDDFILNVEIKSPQAFNVPKLSAMSLFPHAWPTQAPGTKEDLNSFLSEFTTVPMNKAERREADKERHDREKKSGLMPLKDLLLAPAVMADLGFPSKPLDDDWMTIDKADGELDEFYGLDCEMVETEGGKALARVSVVDSHNKSIYDTYVLPPTPVTDYLTVYSGITAEILAEETTTLEDVQKWFKEHIKGSSILVGHSLHFDLTALKLVFHNIIDTSILYEHPRGPPLRPSLKWLAQRFLEKEIQGGNEGHSSIEDSQTCIELLDLKRRRGPEFGMQGNRYRRNMFEKLTSDGKTSAIVDYGVPWWDQGNASTIISVATDAEAASKIVKASAKHDFTYGRFTELARAKGWIHNKEAQDYDISKVYASLNENIQQVIDGVDENTVIVLMSEHGDPTEMKRLQAKKRKYKFEFRTKKWDEIEDPFTDEDGLALTRATARAKLGLAFVALKSSEAAGGPAQKIARLF